MLTAMHVAPPISPIRCLSVDVEEYFHIEAAHGVIRREDWSHLPSRVDRGMDVLLDLFARVGARATMFFLGDVARRHPHLVQRCVAAGHEIGSHGSMHDRLHRLDPRGFRQDALASKRLLEDLAGQPVHGYRAPTWSITRKTAWAIDVLAQCGFTYDASIFPVAHPAYGVPDAPHTPFFVRSCPASPKLLELPPLVYRALGRNCAVAGGGYFRLLPSALMRRGIAQAAAEGRPAILYFHPWEFDADIPRMPLSLTGRLRTYTGLRTAAPRLERILRDTGSWTTIASHLHAMHALAGDAPVFTLAPAAAIRAAAAA